MNLFYLDHNIEKCVKYHCDKHVVKMITETAQLISNVHRICPGKNTIPDFVMNYDKRHSNSPHAKWLRNSIKNYNFICTFGLALYHEYQFRYNNIKKHQRSLKIFEWSLDNQPKLPNEIFSLPPIVMSDEFKINNNIVLSYRNLYMTDKRHFMSWKNRKQPVWFK